MTLPVGHLVGQYLKLTETFIQSLLTHARIHGPLVLTDVLQTRTAGQTPCVYLIKGGEYARMSVADRRYFLSEIDFPNCYASLVETRDLAVLHAHFGIMGRRTLGLKARTGRPLVVSFYGIDASKILRQHAQRPVFDQLFDRADAVVALGTDMARRLYDAGCPRDKVHIVHLGVDLEAISPGDRTRDRDAVVLLYCGRLVEKKGIFDALHAFAQVADPWPNLVFRIVGDGTLKPRLRRAVKRLGLQERVRILGAMPHARVMDEMRRADLFVLPSKTARNGDMEGTPTVLLEAQACGLPVLSTCHADIPEVVVDGQSGFLSTEGDVDGLVEHLRLLLAHPDWWADFGAAGRAHIGDQYNIQKEVGKLEALYGELV